MIYYTIKIANLISNTLRIPMEILISAVVFAFVCFKFWEMAMVNSSRFPVVFPVSFLLFFLPSCFSLIELLVFFFFITDLHPMISGYSTHH